jgi:hypothetical protein
MISNYGRREVPIRQESTASTPYFGSGAVGVSLLLRPEFGLARPRRRSFLGTGIGHES